MLRLHLRTINRDNLLVMWASLVAQTVKEPTFNAEDLSLIPGEGKTPWRREQQPTPVFWPGEFHGQRSLVGYSPTHKESDMTE